nr:unnamed protein product [Callosobruchus analis]
MTSRTSNKISYSTVLLSTAIVEIRDCTGQFQKVRVLFDSGSLPRRHLQVPVKGLNGMSFSCKGVSHCTVRPVQQHTRLFDFEAIVYSGIPLYTHFHTPVLFQADTLCQLGANSLRNCLCSHTFIFPVIGYAAATYFRINDIRGNCELRFICGKSKVAPLKPLSIPRVELLADCLLADLVSLIKDSYSNFVVTDDTYAWSDAIRALHWITSRPYRWKVFVANCTSYIQDRTPTTCWRYVPSSENPADCASRGLFPTWLTVNQDAWPTTSFLESSAPQALTEEKALSMSTFVDTSSSGIFENLLHRFSSLTKILLIITYVRRVIKNKSFSSSANGILTPLEIENILQNVILFVQREQFSSLFCSVEANRLLPKQFRKLAVFIDSLGILRVGGRLKNSDPSFDSKHPILLPKSHRLTDLIIEDTPQKHLHTGFKSLQYILLPRFWILSPRRAIYRCLSRCIRCFKCKSKSYNPPMADLPSSRVT